MMTSRAKHPRLGDIMDPERNSFGVLRCLMASLVLISHSYLFYYGTPAAEPLTSLTGRSLGEHAVQVFFFLSGLLVAQSFDRSRSVFDFAAARVLRIFPGLAVCVVLTALVLGAGMSELGPSQYYSNTGVLAYIAKTISLSTGSAPLPGVFENLPFGQRVNTSLWTLKYEVICYVALGLLGLAGLFRANAKGACTLALAIVSLAVFTGSPANPDDYGLLDNLRYFALFFAPGAAAYLWRDKLIISGLVLIPLLALFVVTIGTQFTELASAAFLGYAALWAASKTFGPLRGACNRLDLSFGIYIYAGPIQQALIETIPGIQPLSIAALAFVSVVPLAILSWVFVEQPSLKLRPRIRALVSRRPRAPEPMPA